MATENFANHGVLLVALRGDDKNIALLHQIKGSQHRAEIGWGAKRRDGGPE